MMKLEAVILIASCLVSILSVFFIPKNKRFQAQFIFSFIQFPTWLLGLIVVELRLLEYPYRELYKVNRTSFIFEYLILPVICIHFNAHFPQHAAKLKKLGLYILVSAMLTGFEAVLGRYTQVIKYTGWEWYWTFVTVCIILWLSRVTTLWFFREEKLA